MEQKRLDFLVFYRGNLKNGFDYIYAKRHEGHAFVQQIGRQEEPKDILDSDFDYYNPHYNALGKPFNWRYREPWTDVTDRWDDLAEGAISYIQTWMPEYRGPSHDDNALNDEWGVRFKVPSQREQIILGLNAFPANLKEFSDFLLSFTQ